MSIENQFSKSPKKDEPVKGEGFTKKEEAERAKLRQEQWEEYREKEAKMTPEEKAQRAEELARQDRNWMAEYIKSAISHNGEYSETLQIKKDGSLDCEKRMDGVVPFIAIGNSGNLKSREDLYQLIHKISQEHPDLEASFETDPYGAWIKYRFVKKIKRETEKEKATNVAIESTRIEKEKKLNAIRQEVDSWGDRLGQGVDEGIKETVAVYNAIGLPTSASCEGHFESGSEHGFPVPWVEVEAPNKPQWRFEREEEIYNQVAKKYGITVDQVIHADNDEAWKEAVRLSAEQEETAEYKVWEEENKKLFARAESLLQEFYKERNVQDELRIIADRSVGGFRVHGGGKFYIPNSQKERIQKELTEEERKRTPEVLRGSQEEMRLFTEFLKKKYFETK